jgi:hypothetical protein
MTCTCTPKLLNDFPIRKSTKTPRSVTQDMGARIEVKERDFRVGVIGSTTTQAFKVGKAETNIIER